MKSYTVFTIIALLFVFSVSFAETIPAEEVLITGACPDGSGMPYDVFGDLLGTIPCGPPGASNAWTGMAYANGMIIQNLNVASAAPQFYKIDPADGTVIGTVTYGTAGAAYVMGVTFDGTDLWTCQFYPSNAIFRVDVNTGAILQTITPAYVCRAIAYDPGSGNLFVGTNAGSNNTMLYEITTAGATVNSWATGTIVGWYMGCDWDADAPAGSNVVIVDNVGNTIEQLVIAGANVTLGQFFACPAATGEGLTWDGADLWHIDAYAALGTFFRYDDGYGGGLWNVTLSNLTGSPVPAIGGQIHFDVHITGPGGAPMDLWIEIPPQVNPPIVPNRTFNFPASGVINRPNQPWGISGTWPAGNYQMIWNVGDMSTWTAWALDSIPFVKSADGDGSGYALWEADSDPLESFMEGLDLGETAVVSEFALMGSYPNPFNPSTTISYTLDNSDLVKLSVYDLSGRQVATLVDGYRDAGSHEVNFDASSLASGVYVYRLSSGQQVASGKMVLMK